MFAMRAPREFAEEERSFVFEHAPLIAHPVAGN